MDREKVIKKFADYVYYFKPYCIGDIEDHAMLKDTLALLKEQDAKNVVNMTFSKDWFRISSCPKCNIMLKWVEHRNYCGYCGQAVKWE